MKMLFIWLLAAGTLLMAPLAADAQYASGTKSGPPIGQVLVREGDYAIRLAGALGVVTTDNEVVAEDRLALLGIAPNSGWISDFPVTPDIIAELQPTIEQASTAGTLLPTGKEDAVRAFVSLNTELGLTITPAASYQGGYAEDQGSYTGSDQAYSEESAPAYSDQAVINDYYEEGPPVITYYAPPPDYAYLYAWDPFPFFWGGIFFPGFFILSDFNFGFGFGFGHGFHGAFFDRDEFAFYRHHHFDHDRAFVSNHVFDRDHRNGFRVDPVTRRPFERTSFRPVGARNFDPVHRSGGINGGRTAFNRDSASRLLGSSLGHNSGGFGRVREGAVRNGEGRVRQSWSGSSMPSRTGRSSGVSSGFGRGSGETRGFQRPSGATGRPFGGSVGSAPSTRSFASPMTQGRSFGGSRSFSGSRSSYSAPSSGGGRSFGRSFSAPSVGGGRSFGGSRSFGSPSFGSGRSFGGGRSFSAQSFGGGHSFGGGSRGFSGGRSGGSMGHGFGGSGRR